MTEPKSKGLTYRDAGVDIAAADTFVDAVKSLAASTHDVASVMPGREYAGLVRLPVGGSRDPMLAATCDGVGTKLLVARDAGRYEGLGQDLVAMNVNDLLPVGARPLIFLDYIATGKLEPDQLVEVVRGIAGACRLAGCALLGGETAEMPGLYRPGDFDLAGFAVGLVEAARIPKLDTLAPGDAIIALPSAGLHANGYSLARKALLERAALGLDAIPAGLSRTLGEELLEPTRVYVEPVLDLLDRVTVKASAHITGGGLLGRLGKMARPGLRLRLEPSAWRRPAIMDLVQRAGSVSDEEMARTFNMGLGYVAVIDRGDRAAVPAASGWIEVGEVVDGPEGVDFGDVTA